jgi:hypothetical protein
MLKDYLRISVTHAYPIGPRYIIEDAEGQEQIRLNGKRSFYRSQNAAFHAAQKLRNGMLKRAKESARQSEPDGPIADSVNGYRVQNEMEESS